MKVYNILILILLPLIVFGQSWDFDAPQKLPGSINTNYEEIFPLLSHDGKTLFFSRILHPLNVGGKFSGSDSWMSTYDEAKLQWSKAFNPKSIWNDRGNTTVIGVNSNNDIIYLLNTSPNRKANGIYISKKEGNGWSRPELVPIEGIDPQGFLGAYVSPDFDVIFLSMKAPDSRGEEDLYISVKGPTGQWSRPKNMGPAINTSGFEISPFLSADKRRLYFSSNGHKGFGDADIFYTDRLYDSWETWSTPRNLGEKLNSKKFDAYFAVYGDSIGYFASNRNGKYSDIYLVKIIPGFEELAFGKRYLTSDEVLKALGSDISRKIIFENETVVLNAAQKELLYYIADKLGANKDINLQISVQEENNKALTDARLNAVANHLRAAGIENFRLMLSNNDKIKRPNKIHTILEINLFR